MVRVSVSLNRHLIRLSLGQAVVVLAGLVHGKLTALYIPPNEWGDYGLMLAGSTLFHGFLIAPTIQSFKAHLVQFSNRAVIQFYCQMLLRIYLAGALLVALAVVIGWQSPVVILVWIAAVGQGI